MNKLIGLLALCWALVAGLASAAQQPQVATTLLGTLVGNNVEISKADDPSGDRHVGLVFNFQRLPANLKREDLTNCTLRVVARRVGTQSGTGPAAKRVAVAVRQEGESRNLGLLGPKPFQDADDSAATSSSRLCDAVWAQYNPTKPINSKQLQLELLTETRSGNLAIYSSHSTLPASAKPRLVLEYRAPKPEFWDSLAWHQHQHDPQHRGRGQWTPIQAPSGFALNTIPLKKIAGRQGKVVGYPLIWHGQIVVVQDLGEAGNWLSAYDMRGNTLWSKQVFNGTLQGNPVISPDGIITLVNETQMFSYSLPKRGSPTGSRGLADSGKLAAYTNLTMADDGSIYVTLRSDQRGSRLLGFNNSMTAFLATPDLGVIHAGTPSLNLMGREVSLGATSLAISVDLTNPQEIAKGDLRDAHAQPGDEFYPPVAVDQAGQMAFADYVGTGADAGNLWLLADQQATRATGGKMPSIPVLGGDGRLRYVQDGELRAISADDKPVTLASHVPQPKSNLVLDAADNLYYWDGGRLLGFDAQGKSLFITAEFKGGPQEFIRLALDPWGTLWTANKHGTRLFAFHPSHAPGDLTITKPLRDQTTYRTSGKLSVRDAGLVQGNRVLLQGGSGVALGPGVRIARGATLLVRSGY